MKAIGIIVLCFLMFSSPAYPGGDDTEVRVFTIQHGRASGLLEVLEHLRSEDGKVTVYDSNNSVIVVDHPENIARMETVIAQLDVAKQKVEIQVLVAEVTEEFLGRIGMEFGQAVLSPEEYKEIPYLIEKSRESRKDMEVFLKTLSGRSARLRVAQEKLFGGTIIRRPDGITVIPRTERAAGGFLEVTPRVNNDGTITVTVMPTMSEFIDDRTVHERTVLTRTTVNSGDTIAIGGVTAVRARAEREGIPFIGVIPSGSSEEHTTVVMFLTATVIE